MLQALQWKYFTFLPSSMKCVCAEDGRRAEVVCFNRHLNCQGHCGLNPQDVEVMVSTSDLINLGVFLGVVCFFISSSPSYQIYKDVDSLHALTSVFKLVKMQFLGFCMWHLGECIWDASVSRSGDEFPRSSKTTLQKQSRAYMHTGAFVVGSEIASPLTFWCFCEAGSSECTRL